MDYLFVGMGMLAASMCAFKAPNTMPKSWAWLVGIHALQSTPTALCVLFAHCIACGGGVGNKQGLVGGLLGVINFLLELGRLGSWMLASEIAGVTMGLLGFIILPIWYVLLPCYNS